MKSLLEEKLSLVRNLNNYTKKIMSLSSNSDSKMINDMIGSRKKYIEDIQYIDAEINKFKSNEQIIESAEIKELKSKIKDLIKNTVEMDKIIRRNINNQLKNIKVKLNQSDTPSLNIKA